MSAKKLPLFVAWTVYASTRMEAMIVYVPKDKNRTRTTNAVKVGSQPGKVEPVWILNDFLCSYISQTSDRRNVLWMWKEKRLQIQFVRASFQRTSRGLTAVVQEWASRMALSAGCAPREHQVSCNMQNLLTGLHTCLMVRVGSIKLYIKTISYCWPVFNSHDLHTYVCIEILISTRAQRAEKVPGSCQALNFFSLGFDNQQRGVQFFVTWLF